MFGVDSSPQAFGAPISPGGLVTPESWPWMDTSDDNQPSDETETPTAGYGIAPHLHATTATPSSHPTTSIFIECPHAVAATSNALAPAQLSITDHEHSRLTDQMRFELAQNAWVTSTRQSACQPPSTVPGNEPQAERRNSSLLDPPLRINNPNGAANTVLGPFGGNGISNRMSRRRMVILRQSEEALAQVSRARRSRAAVDLRWQNLAHQSATVRTRLNRISITQPAPSVRFMRMY